MTVEHPCTRVGAVYLNIDGLSRSDILGVDCYRGCQWVAIKLHHFELVSMQVHGVVDLTCVDHPNQDPFVGLDLQQRVLEGLWERVAIDRVETEGRHLHHNGERPHGALGNLAPQAFALVATAGVK